MFQSFSNLIYGQKKNENENIFFGKNNGENYTTGNNQKKQVDLTIQEFLSRRVGDLLPNEHILNFHEGVDELPDWLGDDLKIIVGAGDNDQKGLNVKELHMFDVFLCLPEDNRGSLRKNVEYLIQNYYHKKVICFIDLGNEEQFEQFCNLFTNRFSLVDGYGGHTPHLSLDSISKILKPGGTAVNIYEGTFHDVYENELVKICSNPTTSLTKAKSLTFFGKISLYEVENPANRNDILFNYAHCLKKHAFELAKTSPIQVDWSIFTYEEPKKQMDLAFLLIGVLLTYDRLPAGLKGVFKVNKRVWLGHKNSELVITKVAQGGRRKRRATRRHRKTRKN